MPPRLPAFPDLEWTKPCLVLPLLFFKNECNFIFLSLNNPVSKEINRAKHILRAIPKHMEVTLIKRITEVAPAMAISTQTNMNATQ